MCCLFSPRKRGSMFLPALVCVFVCVCACVCLFVTTITIKIVDGFVPNFMGRFLGEREDQVRVSLRSVEGCGSNSQKNCVNLRLFTFYTFNSSVTSVAKCWWQNPQISLSRGVVLFQSTFHLVNDVTEVLKNFAGYYTLPQPWELATKFNYR